LGVSCLRALFRPAARLELPGNEEHPPEYVAVPLFDLHTCSTPQWDTGQGYPIIAFKLSSNIAG